MGSFERDFADAVVGARRDLDQEEKDLRQGLDRGQGQGHGRGKRAVWVVVFSPTGCDAMVRVLEQQGQEQTQKQGGKRLEGVFVATIGPTTRDHLSRKLGFEVDVCAERPSQEGVGEGIERFMERWRGTSSM